MKELIRRRLMELEEEYNLVKETNEDTWKNKKLNDIHKVYRENIGILKSLGDTYEAKIWAVQPLKTGHSSLSS